MVSLSITQNEPEMRITCVPCYVVDNYVQGDAV